MHIIAFIYVIYLYIIYIINFLYKKIILVQKIKNIIQYKIKNKFKIK